MADHVRKQIRDRLVTVLTGLTTTGSNVFDSRFYRLSDSNLPALVIMTTDETVEHITVNLGSRNQMRTLNAEIEGFAESATIDDLLDTIAKEVEIALAADPTLNDLAMEIRLTALEVDFEGRSEKPKGRIKLTYEVDYQVDESDPTIAL